jgi:hypothetical protein
MTTLPPSVRRLTRQCRISNISQPYRPPRPVARIAFTFYLFYLHLQDISETFEFYRNWSVDVCNIFKKVSILLSISQSVKIVRIFPCCSSFSIVSRDWSDRVSRKWVCMLEFWGVSFWHYRWSKYVYCSVYYCDWRRLTFARKRFTHTCIDTFTRARVVATVNPRVHSRTLPCVRTRVTTLKRPSMIANTCPWVSTREGMHLLLRFRRHGCSRGCTRAQIHARTSKCPRNNHTRTYMVAHVFTCTCRVTCSRTCSCANFF